jgi:hypothetical protein
LALCNADAAAILVLPTPPFPVYKIILITYPSRNSN